GNLRGLRAQGHARAPARAVVGDAERAAVLGIKRQAVARRDKDESLGIGGRAVGSENQRRLKSCAQPVIARAKAPAVRQRPGDGCIDAPSARFTRVSKIPEAVDGGGDEQNVVVKVGAIGRHSTLYGSNLNVVFTG